jgi:hypothetical protein
MNDFFNPQSKYPVDGLKLVASCPVCQTEHNPVETAILEESDNSHLLYIKCRKCGSGVAASLTPGAYGVASLGVLTDLNAVEIKQATDWGIVSDEDVLGVVESFKKR